MAQQGLGSKPGSKELMEGPHPEPQEGNSPLLRFVEIARRQGPQFAKSHSGFVRQGSAFNGAHLERGQIALDQNTVTRPMRFAELLLLPTRTSCAGRSVTMVREQRVGIYQKNSYVNDSAEELI